MSTCFRARGRMGSGWSHHVGIAHGAPENTRSCIQRRRGGGARMRCCCSAAQPRTWLLHQAQVVWGGGGLAAGWALLLRQPAEAIAGAPAVVCARRSFLESGNLFAAKNNSVEAAVGVVAVGGALGACRQARRTRRRQRA